MITRKKLTCGEDEVSKLFDDADFAGLNVIELRWNEIKSYPQTVYGFDVPKFKKNSNSSLKADNLSIKFVDEPVTFNPDANGRCWAYIVDTDINRDHLRRSFQSGWYQISDQTLRDQLLAEAKEQGITTVVGAKPELHYRKEENEAAQDLSALKEAQQKSRDLEAHLNVALRKIKELEESQKYFEIKKPLAGVRIDKSKLGE